MKLSNETLTILKNFSTINSGIYFKQGNTISTVSPQKNILADAEIQETIPQNFGIYDLTNFLAVISMFKDGAELEFDDKNVIIKGMGGRSKIKYRFTEPSMIVVAPDTRPKLPSVDVEFTLSKEVFDWILRSASVLNSPNIAIESDGELVNLVTFDVSDSSAHTNSVVLSDVNTEDKKYRLIFKTENIKMLPGNYSVEISSKGIAKFTESEKGLVYFVTLETSSVYQ
jgi:gp45 sliding clamp, C terminal